MKRSRWPLAALLLVALGAALLVAKRRADEARQEYLHREMSTAFLVKDKPRIIELLRIGADPNDHYEDGTPMIFDALPQTTNDDFDLLLAFLNAGADPNARRVVAPDKHQTYGETLLLQIATEYEYALKDETPDNAVRALVDHGARMQESVSLSTGSCPTGAPCWIQPRRVEFLLRHGARLSKSDRDSLFQGALNVADQEDVWTLMVWQLNIWLTNTPSADERHATTRKLKTFLATHRSHRYEALRSFLRAHPDAFPNNRAKLPLQP